MTLSLAFSFQPEGVGGADVRGFFTTAVGELGESSSEDKIEITRMCMASESLKVKDGIVPMTPKKFEKGTSKGELEVVIALKAAASRNKTVIKNIINNRTAMKSTVASKLSVVTKLFGKKRGVDPSEEVIDKDNVDKEVIDKDIIDEAVAEKEAEKEAMDKDVIDKEIVGLSYVGASAHNALRKHHSKQHRTIWNVTSGVVVDSVQQTPRNSWDVKDDPPEGHDDWLPENMGRLISRTEGWCDVMSLSPPDGKFVANFRSALVALAERSKTTERPIVVRMMFGDVARTPVDCSSVLQELTNDLPSDANLHLWVGEWRRGVSWNHAKLIAVDGVRLHTGGHNLRDAHYLSTNPVHDLSIEFEGKVAQDGHIFADQQWALLEKKQRSRMGSMANKMPDSLPKMLRTRGSVCQYPEGVASVHPPQFSKSVVAELSAQSLEERSGDFPLISIGRQGAMVSKNRPSDDAILAMIDSSKTVIRMVLQDLGPACIPGQKKALASLKWPKEYLDAIGRAIHEREVNVEIILSNPNAIPGGIEGTEDSFGNGWDCGDVASEIIQKIQKQFKENDESKLRSILTENLRICFIRHDKENSYNDGTPIGLHSNHIIVDDLCCYIGSQNLYTSDLAEWGVIIDSEEEVRKITNDYFNAMWRNSFTGEDVDVEKVMDECNVDRDGAQKKMFSGMKKRESARPAPQAETPELHNVDKRDEEDNYAEEKPVAGDAKDKIFPSENDAKENSDEKVIEQRSIAPPPVEMKEEAPVTLKDIVKESTVPPKVHEETKDDEVTLQDQTTMEEAEEYPDNGSTLTDKGRMDCNWCGLADTLGINK